MLQGPSCRLAVSVAQLLAVIGKENSLVFAQCWTPLDPSDTAPDSAQVRLETLNGSSCVHTFDENLLAFHQTCGNLSVLEGDGLVGSAYSTRRLVFCHDVQTLTPSQYPLVAYARQFGLHACVCLLLQRGVPGEEVSRDIQIVISSA
jgi:hypothetical protein